MKDDNKDARPIAGRYDPFAHGEDLDAQGERIKEALKNGPITSLSQAKVEKCPHTIMEPSHFEYDPCDCFNKQSSIMSEWGYTWSPPVLAWITGEETDPDPINAVDLRVMRHSVHANVHCCLCDAGPLDHPDLHNASPLGPVDSDDEWGRYCCTECNNGKVIPARIEYMNKAHSKNNEVYDRLSPDQAIEAGTKVVKALEELVAQGALGDHTAEELWSFIKDEYPNLKLHFPKQEDKDGD